MNWKKPNSIWLFVGFVTFFLVLKAMTSNSPSEMDVFFVIDERIVNFIIGLSFFCAGLYGIGKPMFIGLRAFRLKAKVVSVEWDNEGDRFDNKPTYEVLETHTNWKSKWLAGKLIQSEVGGSLELHSVGDVVDIFYDVKSHRVVSKREWIVTCIFGILFSMIGLYIMYIQFAQTA